MGLALSALGGYDMGLALSALGGYGRPGTIGPCGYGGPDTIGPWWLW